MSVLEGLNPTTAFGTGEFPVVGAEKTLARRVSGRAGFDSILHGAIASSASTRPGASQFRDQKLFGACVEMESLLVFQMLKAMRRTVPKGGLMDGGFREEIFRSMLDEQYALLLSRTTSLGLAEAMYRQVEPGFGTEEKDAAARERGGTFR